MIVILNARACGGKAETKWNRIEPRVREKLGDFTLYPINDWPAAEKFIQQSVGRGQRDFVAAGGDGTINFLLNSLVGHAPVDILPAIKLGAIGLGSSNDFHKPFAHNRRIDGVPCRTNFDNALPHDVGVISFKDEAACVRTKYWLINTSIGITAEANLLFNQPGRILGLLKRTSTDLAILYAALSTLFKFRARELRVSINDNEPEPIEIENLGIVKNPNFSGSFCYNSPFEIDSGRFYLHVIEKRSIPSKMLLLWKLSRPKHRHDNLTKSFPAQHVVVEASHRFAVELDGEVFSTDRVEFSIIRTLLKVAT